MTSEHNFDPSWPHGHVTRDGRKARIVATDYQRDMTLAIVTEDNGYEYTSVHWADGRKNSQRESANDLVNAPEPVREIWVNVYPEGNGTAADSREKADMYAARDRIACLGPYPWKPGDGL